MEIISTVPLLRIYDVAKAREFYSDSLGFTSDWETHYEDGLTYVQISRGPRLVFHLTEAGAGCPNVSVIILIRSGLAVFHREIASRLPKVHREIAIRNYRSSLPDLPIDDQGDKWVEVLDAFGNKLYFKERIYGRLGGSVTKRSGDGGNVNRMPTSSS